MHVALAFRFSLSSSKTSLKRVLRKNNKQTKNPTHLVKVSAHICCIVPLALQLLHSPKGTELLQCPHSDLGRHFLGVSSMLLVRPQPQTKGFVLQAMSHLQPESSASPHSRLPMEHNYISFPWERLRLSWECWQFKFPFVLQPNRASGKQPPLLPKEKADKGACWADINAVITSAVVSLAVFFVC